MGHRPGCRAASVSLAFLLCLLALALPARAQQITYEYDALGRLTVVSSPDGVAQYEYDAVGNLLRITTRRSAEVSGPVAILLVTPAQGAPGTTVHLYGKGFALNPADNQLAFTGAAAPVTAATTTTLTTTVPPGATTGPLTLTTPLGAATAPEAFTVLQRLAIVPDQADVALGGLVDFQATLDGAPTTAVTWRVNGLVGGSATLGTITPAGTYTAPAGAPPVQPVPIEAVLIADPGQGATAQVRIAGQPGGLSAAAPVSVTGAAPTSTPTVSAPVSVTSAGAAALAGSGPLSVTRGPVIRAVNPAAAPAGTAALALSLTGANLQGATTLQLLRAGLADATVTASGVTAASDGTRLTATLAISGSAPAGLRVLQVVTPQGTSTSVDLGTNTFTVTAP